MRIKHPKTRVCVACGNPTTLTQEALTRKDVVVSYPCCSGCRTEVSASLLHERGEMEREMEIDRIIAKMRLDDVLIDPIAGDYRDLSNAEHWQFVPSFKSKVVIERAVNKIKAKPIVDIASHIMKQSDAEEVRSLRDILLGRV